MSGVFREYESVEWFIFRYTNLRAMPYSELGQHYIDGTKIVLSETLRIKETVSAGYNSSKEGRAHAQFPRLYTREAQGPKQYMHGLKELTKVVDSPLMRAMLYLNLVAALAELPQLETKLFLWIPQTSAEYTSFVNKGKKYPNKNLDTSREARGVNMMQIQYNKPLMDKWLAFAQRHPDYCMTPEWEQRLIDYNS